MRGLEFTRITSRTELWWFALAGLMVLAFADLLAEVAGPLPLQLASLLVLLPWVAACSRRLRDAGYVGVFLDGERRDLGGAGGDHCILSGSTTCGICGLARSSKYGFVDVLSRAPCVKTLVQIVKRPIFCLQTHWIVRAFL